VKANEATLTTAPNIHLLSMIPPSGLGIGPSESFGILECDVRQALAAIEAEEEEDEESLRSLQAATDPKSSAGKVRLI
jgi:hypothetical protein